MFWKPDQSSFEKKPNRSDFEKKKTLNPQFPTPPPSLFTLTQPSHSQATATQPCCHCLFCRRVAAALPPHRHLIRLCSRCPPPASPSKEPSSASVPTSAGGPSIGVPPVGAPVIPLRRTVLHSDSPWLVLELHCF
ncbi:hypothetical protein PIB30_001060 [Stylosanthes scabra]|uniref:Uncharacterized protein n=1 Tax=Stylosanthes scabra TaxID=79078 RepID=A0ABU6U2C3_9FABA|nr:hypothetical protein [Stylosanthes scabra]